MRPALALVACFLVLLIGGGARFAIGLTFKPMVDEFGWSRGELGLAVGLYMVVSAFATLITGRMADRFSPRALLIGGTVIGGAGIAADEPGDAAVARARALRRRVRDRQRRGFARHRRRDRDARLSGPRGPRQRDRGLGHERRPARHDRDPRRRDGADRLARGVRLDRRRASGAAAAAGRHSGAERCGERAEGRALAARRGALAPVLAAHRDLRDLRARRFLRHHACGGVRAGPRPEPADRRQSACPDGSYGPCRRDRVGACERPARAGLADRRGIRRAHRRVRHGSRSTSRRSRSRCSRWCSARRSWSRRRSPWCSCGRASARAISARSQA